MSPGVAQALFAKTAWDPCKLRYIHLMLLVLLLTAYVPTIAYLSYFFTAKTVEKDLRWLAVSSCSEVGRSGIRKKPPPATHGHCSLSSQNPLSHWWWPASGPDCAKLRFNVANRFCWSKQNKQMDYKIVSRTFNKYIYIYMCVFKPDVCPCNPCILFFTTGQSHQRGSVGCPWKALGCQGQLCTG